MKKIIYQPVSLLLILFSLTFELHAQTKITVDLSKSGHIISPSLFGIFFEDINLSAPRSQLGDLEDRSRAVP